MGCQPSAAADSQLIVAISDHAAAFKYDGILIRPDGTVVRPLGLTWVSNYNANPVLLPGGKELLFLADSPALGSSAPHYAL